jgi:hypothetical protein
MNVIGIVKNGVVVLPPDAHFEEGQRVEIVFTPVSSQGAYALRETASGFPTVRNLPDDLSINLDYYLHGHKHKQQPRLGRWIPAGEGAPELSEQEVAEFTDKLLELASETANLPPDLSSNHDHYLHGLPK